MKFTKRKLRNKADKLFQEYLKEKHSLCLVCENYTTVIHHFIPKANSNALRYNIKNGIPLCQSCHYKVHTQPHLIEPIICFKLGQEWYNDLIKVKQEKVKANLTWYETQLLILENLKNGESWGLLGNSR